MNRFQVDTTHYDMDSLLVEVDGDIVRIEDSEDMLEMSRAMLQSIAERVLVGQSSG